MDQQVEDALRKREQEYRYLYEEAPLAYLSVGTDKRICRVNQQAVAFFQMPLDELLGRQVIDLYADTPCGKPRARKIFERFRSGESILGEEVEMQRADGCTRWVAVSVRPILDEDGTVLESRSILEDITERKEAEEALEEIKSNPRLRQIPIVVMSTSGAEADIAQSYDLGVNSYITKPVSFDGLVEVIRALGQYWFQVVELPPAL